MDEYEGCSHCHLWLLVDVYHLGEIFRAKQRQDELTTTARLAQRALWEKESDTDCLLEL